MVKHWRTASRRLETIWVFMVRQQSCNNAIQDEDRRESDGWKTRRLRCLTSISFLRRQRKLNSCSNSRIPKSNYQNCHCWSIVIFYQSFYLNFVKKKCCICLYMFCVKHTCWKQLRTLGSMLEPPKAATSPSCLGIWMASWSRSPSCLWSHVSPADATWLNRSGQAEQIRERWGKTVTKD